jgi:hypothetical protein
MDKLDLVRKLMLKVYSADTSFNPSGWSKENPTYGHCAVVSLVLNDWLDAKIAKVKVNGESHYFNIIDGNIIDLTGDQFGHEVDYSNMEMSTREYLLSNENTKERYELLKKRFEFEFYESCYNCDKCGTRHLWEEINWITSSYGACEDCYSQLSEEEKAQIEIDFE